MPTIELSNVTKNYKNIRALDNINLEINKDEAVLMLGSNGSGKSTVIKLILGYIKIGKRDCGRIYKEDLKIGYVPERVYLPKSNKVKDYLKDYYSLKETDFDYLELAKYFDLDVDKGLNELSKGMKQKVALVLALDSNNDMYILDEATNGLDDESIKKLVGKLIELKNMGKGIIIVSHYKDIYEKICSREITFSNSRILEDKLL